MRWPSRAAVWRAVFAIMLGQMAAVILAGAYAVRVLT